MLADFGLRFVFVVLLLSGLSFLGLGVQPPNADWGSLVRENIGGLSEGAPAVLMPAIAIATLTIGVNLLDRQPAPPRRPRTGSRVMNMIEVKGLRVVAGAAPDAGRRDREGRRLHGAAGRSARADRRVGLGQDDHRARAAGPCARAAARSRRLGAHRRRRRARRSIARGRRALRARTVAYIAQSAAAAFNPSRTIMDQVIEPALPAQADDAAPPRATKAVALFRALALPDAGDDRRALSAPGLGRPVAAPDGGDGADHRSRASSIFDEPTTALDVTTQIEVLRAFKTRGARARHDGGVRVARSRGGRADGRPHRRAERRHACARTARPAQVLDAPADDVHAPVCSPRRAARSRNSRRRRTNAAPPLLEIRGLTAGYGRIDRDGMPAVRVLDDVEPDASRAAARSA